jgi:hypothetical protein
MIPLLHMNALQKRGRIGGGGGLTGEVLMLSPQSMIGLFRIIFSGVDSILGPFYDRLGFNQMVRRKMAAKHYRNPQEAKIKMRNPERMINDPGQIDRTLSRSLKKRIPTARVKGISTCFTAST